MSLTPFLSVTLTSAPCFSSSLTISVCPGILALPSGVSYIINNNYIVYIIVNCIIIIIKQKHLRQKQQSKQTEEQRPNKNRKSKIKT